MAKLLVGMLIALSITALFNYYIWRRLVRDTALPARARHIATMVLVVMWPSTQLTMFLSRTGASSVGRALGYVTFPWMAVVGLTFVCLVVIDLVRLLAHTVGAARRRRWRTAPEEVDHSRRSALARITGGAALAVSTGSVAYGATEARGEHEICTVEVVIANLPPALDGFTIVQLTDLHVGNTVGRGFVEKVVSRANAAAPDLIVLTGDMVDGSVADLRDDFAPLGDLRAPHGVYAITGNHEYYSGVDAWIAEWVRLGFTPLRNQRVEIRRGDAVFDLAGIDDHGAAMTRGHGPDLAAALADRDQSRPLVLLAHQPRQARAAASKAVDLVLSGHTHGGQVWPWHYLVKAQQGGLLSGRYQLSERTLLYVSRGCGYWGPPVRVGAPLEITKVVLRRASVSQQS